MANLTLKNVPDELLERIRRRASQNRRSMNSEAILCLEQAVRAEPVRGGDERLSRLRAFRGRYRLPALTPEFLDEAKHEGRE